MDSEVISHRRHISSVMEKLFICIILFSIFALSAGCGSDKSTLGRITSNETSRNNTQPTRQTHTEQQTPAQELTNIIAKADAMAFTLSVRGPINYPVGKETWTQKGKSYRVDWVIPDEEASGGTWRYIHAIHNSQQKQIAGYIYGYDWDGRTENITSGWQRPVFSGKDVNLDTNRQNIIIAALNGIGKANTSVYTSDGNYLWMPHNAIDLRKEKDGFSYLINSASTTRFFLECKGPEGLPSNLIEIIPALGANPEVKNMKVEFIYSNVNQVPDSTFQIPAGIPVGTPQRSVDSNSFTVTWTDSLFSHDTYLFNGM